MGTIQEFIVQHHLTMTSVRVPENPNNRPNPNDKRDVQWHKEAGHFLCTIYVETPGHHPIDRSIFPHMSTYYSMGSGHRKPIKGPFSPRPTAIHHQGKWWDFPAPKLEDVLDCLASDAASVENSRHFEDWCIELGYDPDSRRAERTYNLCKDQAAELEHLLGRPDFKTLLFDTERL